MACRRHADPLDEAWANFLDELRVEIRAELRAEALEASRQLLLETIAARFAPAADILERLRVADAEALESVQLAFVERDDVALHRRIRTALGLG